MRLCQRFTAILKMQLLACSADSPLGYAQRALQDVLRQVCRFYGHSWGGILAIEYALNHQQHLRGLVISDMTAGTQSYLKRTASIKSQLPLGALARLTALEAKEDYDSLEYQKIMMEDLYPKMLCRIEPLARACFPCLSPHERQDL
jgi:pimeloyl-ACP methyl ester carboxylesterase